jgi:hypothetical protein
MEASDVQVQVDGQVEVRHGVGSEENGRVDIESIMGPMGPTVKHHVSRWQLPEDTDAP